MNIGKHVLNHISSLQSSRVVGRSSVGHLLRTGKLLCCSAFQQRVCERLRVSLVGQLVSCWLAAGPCSHLSPPPTLPEKRSARYGTVSIGVCVCCRTTPLPPPPPCNSSGCCDSSRQQDLGLHLGFLCQETAVSAFPPSQDPLLQCTLLSGQSDGFFYHS